MSAAFQNAYEYAVGDTRHMSEARAEDNTLTTETVYLDAEQALRDWDGFVGPRRTNYVPEQYELTDSEWKDCLYSVYEFVCEVMEVKEPEV